MPDVREGEGGQAMKTEAEHQKNCMATLLKEYGGHKQSCSFWGPAEEECDYLGPAECNPCNCGWRELSNALNAADASPMLPVTASKHALPDCVG